MVVQPLGAEFETGGDARPAWQAVEKRQLARADSYLLVSQPDHAKLSGDLADAVAQTVRSAMELRLRVVREIIKVLTPEQRKLVQAELEKPGANPDLAETVTKMFGLKK